MNKSEFVRAISEKSGFTLKDVDAAWKATEEVIAEALAAGDKISISGFGIFDCKSRPARDGINPKTGEKIKIAASKSPVFKAGKGLKDSVSK